MAKGKGKVVRVARVTQAQVVTSVTIASFVSAWVCLVTTITASVLSKQLAFAQPVRETTKIFTTKSIPVPSGWNRVANGTKHRFISLSLGLGCRLLLPLRVPRGVEIPRERIP